MEINDPPEVDAEDLKHNKLQLKLFIRMWPEKVPDDSDVYPLLTMFLKSSQAVSEPAP